jgi:amino acid transporter
MSTEASGHRASGAALPDNDPGPHVDRLQRQLGIWSAAAVLVGTTIGSGIFRVPSGVAEQVGTSGAILMLWVVGGAIALFGALTVAELAALFPRSGGIYVFLREAYGPLPAFLFGWTQLLVIRPSALGGIAMLFAEYVRVFAPLTGGQVRMVAAAAIVGLAAANIFSVRFGSRVQNASAAAKVATLLGLVVAAFAFGNFAGGSFAQPMEWSPLSWGGFGIALVSVMWAYDGWADLTFVAGEVRDPERTLPRALLGGTLAVVVIYLLVNVAYLYVLPAAEMPGKQLVASDAARTIFGQVGAAVVAAMVMLSAFGALNGSTMTGPRIFYAMAEDGLFFRPIAAVHPRFRTPFAAIMLASALGIGYVSFRTFEGLANAFVLGIWPFYVLAVIGVFLLRRSRPDLHRPYRTWGYPVVPAVFLVASIAMLANAAFRETRSTLIGFGIILAGIPVFYAWQAIRRRNASGAA